MTTALQDIQNFLPCKTPDRWLENALDNQAIMLIDHILCSTLYIYNLKLFIHH